MQPFTTVYCHAKALHTKFIIVIIVVWHNNYHYAVICACISIKVAFQLLKGALKGHAISWLSVEL